MQMTIHKGTVIFNEGDAGGDVYVIHEGFIDEYSVRNGKEWPLARLGAGEVLGLMTAMDGGKRHASARAETDVVVTCVKYKQISEMLQQMPAWGGVIVRDLIARVENSNKLYFENAAMADGAQISDDPLAFASFTASAMLPVMKMMMTKDKHIPIEQFVLQLAEVLGVPTSRVDAVINVFRDEKLLESGEDGPGGKGFNLAAVKSIGEFAEFVKEVRAATADPAKFRTLPENREREILQDVVDYALSKIKDGETMFEISISSLEIDLKKEKSNSFDMDVLKKAAALGYLEIKNDVGLPSLQLNPFKLARTLRLYAAAKKFDQRFLAERKTRRSLVY